MTEFTPELSHQLGDDARANDGQGTTCQGDAEPQSTLSIVPPAASAPSREPAPTTPSDGRYRTPGSRSAGVHAPRGTVGQRWKYLAEAAASLDASVDYRATLASVVDHAILRTADACIALLLRDDGSMCWGHSAHRRPDLAPVAEDLRQFLSRRGGPDDVLLSAVRSGKPQLLPVVDEPLLAWSPDDVHRPPGRRLGPASCVVVPLSARDRLLGVLVFALAPDSGHRYTVRDLAAACRLGAHLALAVDRAVLHAAAQRATHGRDELLAIVSHDLKNPLATIQMAAQMLLQNVVPNDTGHLVERNLLGAVTRASDRMFRLVHDWLDLSHENVGPLRIDASPCAPEALVTDAIDAQRELGAAKGIAIDGRVAPGLPAVRADADRVGQIFANLIGNALKFTPTNGCVTVGAACAPDGPAPGWVRFAVRDSGPGIAPADQLHVFERFWQVPKTARLGTGLGLAIVRMLVEAHGGQVGVESAPGTGSTFWFTLPAASEHET